MFWIQHWWGKKNIYQIGIPNRTLWHETMLLCGNVLFHTPLVLGHKGLKETWNKNNWQRKGPRLLSQAHSQSVRLCGQQPNYLCITGSKENMNADKDSFLVKPFKKNTYLRTHQVIKFPGQTNVKLIRHCINYRTWPLRSHSATVGLLQGEFSCRFCDRPWVCQTHTTGFQTFGHKEDKDLWR